jgi:hypothetical protein
MELEQYRHKGAPERPQRNSEAAILPGSLQKKGYSLSKAFDIAQAKAGLFEDRLERSFGNRLREVNRHC